MKQSLSMAHTPLLKVLLWSLLVFLQFHEHTACFQEERIALLELKAFLKSNIIMYEHHRLLSSWIGDANSDCCGWERVICNSTTAHVINLSLYNIKEDPECYEYPDDCYYKYEEKKHWLLNVSLLVPFKELRSLNLSGNVIGGCLPNQGFEKLSSLKNLRVLDLSHNYFDNLPPLGFESLSRLENLETLDLSYSGLNTSTIEPLSALKSLLNLNLAGNYRQPFFHAQDFESLARLEKLETLDFSDNYYFNISIIIESLSTIKSLKNLNLARNEMTGSFPPKGLSNLSKLEILDLTFNDFVGSISPDIGALSSLKAISLRHNLLNGTLPKELCALKKLEELDFYDNSLEGTIPPCLNNMTNLRLLDISSNQFTGNISSSLIAIPISLGYIDLSYNLFEGLFSFSLLANHSKLEVIILDGGNNKLEVETENSADWDPSFQLKVLVLRNCNLNKLIGNIPKFLFHQSKLEIIDLSHNNLTGSFPNWLLENNTGLRELNCPNNSFFGKFHLPQDRYESILSIDVSDNQLDGQLQEIFGKSVPYLRYLNLSQNRFEGYLPSSIGNMSNLEVLDLSINNFSGELTAELLANCTSLEILTVCYNRFNGEFFTKDMKLQSLYVLNLNDNQFTGTLPVVPWDLFCLYINNNNMSGTIPRWIVNSTYMHTLGMSNNSFEGQIPCGQHSLDLLDLSHNSLSGSIPPCLNLPIGYLCLQGNKLTGAIPKVFLNSPLSLRGANSSSSFLLTLDLSDNYFSGSIPHEIGAFSNLRILLLGGNRFSGRIPNQLCWLNKLGIMDLSNNFLSGKIPDCFHNISFGKTVVTDLAYDRYYSVATSTYKEIGSTFQRLTKWNIEEEGHLVEAFDENENKNVKVEFVTKYRSYLYSGRILYYMSGLDLSCNNLSGRIPLKLGELSSILTLNLSYNHLTGSIPKTFSKLANLESLDLSHNNLNGEIPSALIDLNFIEVFIVAHNNLSGKVPDMKAQFSTFERSSYEGNPFLCGQPLESCTREDEPLRSPTKSLNASEGKWYEVDPQVFYASFIASYIIFFLSVACLLYIHPYWLQRCFKLIKDLKYWCYYPVFDTLKGFPNRLQPWIH